MQQIRAVVFDVYGTLVHIADKRMPFRKLARRRTSELGEGESAAVASTLMSEPLDLRQAEERLGIQLNDAERLELQADLMAEIASLTIFPEVVDTLDHLQQAGYKLALCSNLALPYGPPVRLLLPQVFAAYVWSYETGCVKPDPRIYLAVAEQMSLAPNEILFVGDTLVADVDGPRAIGMEAVHLFRNKQPSDDDASIAKLSELTHLLAGDR